MSEKKQTSYTIGNFTIQQLRAADEVRDRVRAMLTEAIAQEAARRARAKFGVRELPDWLTEHG